MHPHHIAVHQFQADRQAQQRAAGAQHHVRRPLVEGDLAAVFTQGPAHQRKVAGADRRRVARPQDAPRTRVAREDGAVGRLHDDAFGQVVDGQAVALFALLQLTRDVRLLDRHADNVGNAVKQPHRVVRGGARRVVVDAHRADHLRVVAADGGRPAGAQSERLDDVAVVVPQRVGVDVFHHHALVEEHGRAARAVRRPDRQPDQHLREHERQ